VPQYFALYAWRADPNCNKNAEAKVSDQPSPDRTYLSKNYIKQVMMSRCLLMVWESYSGLSSSTQHEESKVRCLTLLFSLKDSTRL
jgi:hypothetical protein